MGALGSAQPQKSSRLWESLNPPLSPWILDAVSSMGFKRMTPVQASTIPLAMGNKDVVVEAVTGSGKTLAFLVPVIEKLLRMDEPVKKHHVGAIVISPTRELAAQIYNVLQGLLAFHGPSRVDLQADGNAVMDDGAETGTPSVTDSGHKIVPQLLVGGDTTPANDLKVFLQNSPNLLVATPGRLLELLKSPHVHCPQSSFEILIMDEADRLLDLGFKDDLQKILGKLPKQRRTGLFSASVSEAVDQIVRVGLRNPVKIAVKVKGALGKDDQRTPSALAMTYLVAKASHRLPLIAKILAGLAPVPIKTIIYLSTCAAVDYMQSLLPVVINTSGGPSINIVPLHGKHPANVRKKNFTHFSCSLVPSILLTTDVAARGLDIPQVDLVIQIDPPSDPKAFMHRCGRAGRAGRKGLSIVLLQPGREEEYVPFLEIRKTPIRKFEDVKVYVTDEEANAAVKKMRQVVLQDKALHDKAQKAFVSWVQAYSKHHASSIFRVADLDWNDLGHSWALLRLPRMPELKNWAGDRTLGLHVDWSTYAYKNKQREVTRLKNLQKQPEEVVVKESARPTRKSNAWSQKQDLKKDKEKRREKKQAKRVREKAEKMTTEEKERQTELERLISEVKRSKTAQDDMGDFNGFGD